MTLYTYIDPDLTVWSSEELADPQTQEVVKVEESKEVSAPAADALSGFRWV